MGFAVGGSLADVFDFSSAFFGGHGGGVVDVHFVDFEPAADEGDGMGEEGVIGGEQVAVGGGSEEIGKEGEDGDGEEGGLDKARGKGLVKMEVEGWRCNLTKVIQMWIARFVRNQYQKVPFAGIILGYFLFLRASLSTGEIVGPGYWRGAFLSRAGWEGGLNLVGFSRRIGLMGLA